MTRFLVRPTGALRGTVQMPGDKSIAHRWLMLAALSEGTCVIDNVPAGTDVRATIEALRAMGVAMRTSGARVEVDGVGLHGLSAPGADIDCQNSGTTMRLLAGLLAGLPLEAELVGDASLSRRPMGRIVEPLRARGANILGVADADGGTHAPLTVHAPARRLGAIEYSMPVASAQVKGALLLSGLHATGPTRVREPLPCRDHTERLLIALGMAVVRDGSWLTFEPTEGSGRIPVFAGTLPGDLSSASFALAAASLVHGSEVTVEGVGLNPTRTGFLDAVSAMGAPLTRRMHSEVLGEPVGTAQRTHTRLGGITVQGESVPQMIDEIPLLCALAATADGDSVVRGAAELRLKESDRIAGMTSVLRGFGITCRPRADELRIMGGGRLRAGCVSSGGDHRVAMAATVLALAADGESVIEDVDCVDTSFPEFTACLVGLGADIVRVEDDPR